MTTDSSSASSHSKPAGNQSGGDKSLTKTAAKAPQKGSSSEGLTAFFKSIVSEFHKISWPTKPQIWANTVVVIMVVIIVSTGMYVVDNIFRATIWFLTQELPKHIG